MPFWCFLFAAGMVAVGLGCFFHPAHMWEMFESWKSYSASDPSDWYIRSTKISGALLLLCGVAFAVFTVYGMVTGQI